MVKESQEEAKVDPEASAVAEEVKEKAAVEEELLETVPEAPPPPLKAPLVKERTGP